MSQVNLLPPEILQRQQQRRKTMSVVAAGGAVLVLILAFFLVQNGRLSSVNDQVAAQDAKNQSIQTQIDGLADAATLQAQAQAAQSELDAAWAGEVSFSGLLMDVSRVIPSDMVLTNLTFTLTVAGAGTPAPTTGGTAFVGSMSASGTGASAQSVSTWLTRLGSVKGWENPWVSSGSLQEDETSYQFTSTVDLSSDVVTPRGQGKAP